VPQWPCASSRSMVCRAAPACGFCGYASLAGALCGVPGLAADRLARRAWSVQKPTCVLISRYRHLGLVVNTIRQDGPPAAEKARVLWRLTAREERDGRIQAQAAARWRARSSWVRAEGIHTKDGEHNAYEACQCTYF